MIQMRQPCKKCQHSDGSIATVNGQDTVRCSQCDTFQYNAPKTETGRKVRTISTTHEMISASLRARILERATGRCEICGSGKDLHVGHVLSVADGHAEGLTDQEINNPDNLAAMCAACNLGQGSISLPPRFLAALLHRRRAA